MHTKFDSPKTASSISLGANVFLTFSKLIGGIIAHSQALISDGVNSLDDIVSTIVVMVGVRRAARKADRDHQFGHERMDNVAAIILSLLFFMTGLTIIYAGGYSLYQTFNSGASLSLPSKLAWIVAGLAILIKESLFIYTHRVGIKSNSSSIKGLALDHQMDVVSTSVALVGIVLAISLDKAWIDPLAAMITGLLIIVTGIKTIFDALNKMTDHAADVKTDEAIRAVIDKVAGVVRIDVLRTRLFGNRIYVDAEIAVDYRLSLRNAHTIAENVHHQVETSFPEVKHIMIHVNPDQGLGAYEQEKN